MWAGASLTSPSRPGPVARSGRLGTRPDGARPSGCAPHAQSDRGGAPDGTRSPAGGGSAVGGCAPCTIRPRGARAVRSGPRRGRRSRSLAQRARPRPMACNIRAGRGSRGAEAREPAEAHDRPQVESRRSCRGERPGNQQSVPRSAQGRPYERCRTPATRQPRPSRHARLGCGTIKTTFATVPANRAFEFGWRPLPRIQ